MRSSRLTPMRLPADDEQRDAASPRARSGRALLVSVAVVVVLAQVAGPVVAHHAGRPIGSFSTCRRLVTPPRCSSVGNDTRHFVAFDATPHDRARRVAARHDDRGLRADQARDDPPGRRDAGDRCDRLQPGLRQQRRGRLGVLPARCATGRQSPRAIAGASSRSCTSTSTRAWPSSSPMTGAVTTSPATSWDTPSASGTGATRRRAPGPPAATCMNANTPDGPTILHQVDWDHIDAYRYTMHPPPRRQRPDGRTGRRVDATALGVGRHRSWRPSSSTTTPRCPR